MERSEIRDNCDASRPIPDYAALHPGYETTKKKRKRNADKRFVQLAVQLARPRILRDALACRRSTAVLTYGLSPVARDFRPGLLGRGNGPPENGAGLV